MELAIADKWKDYRLLDAGDGERLEQWGPYLLRRPDPQIIWPRVVKDAPWDKADAHYTRSSEGGGAWSYRKQLPETWDIGYGDLKFRLKTMGFKHTGLFPEQAANWEWMMGKIRGAGRPINVLNLFAYTGGATVACASAGASVCHVDAAKGMVNRASENLRLSGIEKAPVRWIVDDVLAFVAREVRRGKKYDAVIMDPPSYGLGPKGEVWHVEEKLFLLVSECAKILSDKPLFFLINGYTTRFSSIVLANVLRVALAKHTGDVMHGELGLPVADTKIVAPCGSFARWYEV